MSSDSDCESVGPSSFTENLTLYMNGQREPVFAVDSTNATSNAPMDALKDQDNATKAQIESIAEGQNDIQTLRDELEAALKRHNELMAENQRLVKDLEASTAKALRVGPLERELEDARASLKESEPRMEATMRQLEVSRLRTEELEREVTEKSAETRKAQEDEFGRVEKIDALQRELERQEESRRDELSDQSLIDELEDDLERTRHELDKAIKDRQRVERQLDFTKGDYEAEKQRVVELQEQLAISRQSEKDSLAAAALGTYPSTPASPIARNGPMAPMGIEALQTAMARADLRIDGLESQLQEARSAIQAQSKELANTAKQAEERVRTYDDEEEEEMPFSKPDAQKKSSQGPGTNQSQSDTAMDRAEAYIRKLKAQEATLKRDLLTSEAERDELRAKLADVEDALKDSQDEAAVLMKQVEDLEETKERMGRVLMYQWGKEEVGEIEKRRGDGKKERGMGYKYKYFNKDGSLKDS